MHNKKISVALSGGGAAGFAHIPIIQAFEDLGIKPYAISGTSMGALLGAAWAGGMTSTDIINHCEELWSDKTELLKKFWKLKSRQSKEIFRGGGIIQFNPSDVLNLFMPSDYPQRFEELKIPFTAVAADFYDWKEKHFTKGDINLAIAASIAIPAIFKPVFYKNTLLVDGGCVNPMPFDVLPTDSDIIIACDVLGGPLRPKDVAKPPSALNTILGASDLLMQSIINQKLQTCYPHILLRPDTRAFKVLEFHHFAEIIDSAQHLREDIKRQLDRILEVQKHQMVNP